MEFFKRFFRDLKNGERGSAFLAHDLLTIVFAILAFIVTLVKRFLC